VHVSDEILKELGKEEERKNEEDGGDFGEVDA
jgi:hypothetical protein